MTDSDWSHELGPDDEDNDFAPITVAALCSGFFVGLVALYFVLVNAYWPAVVSMLGLLTFVVAMYWVIDDAY